ncbi:MAG: hypothetical protein GKS03_07590 [Alphaproteobacteria bacterium]|nr:hypothetical protein [Alphaproteobacteria bacterium]
MSLAARIQSESQAAAFPAAEAMVEHLKDTYGPGVRAIVFYGSCLRLGTDENLMLDFYVLVDGLGDALQNPISAAFGALLPPNVYYHECDFDGRVVRAKVAVMTLGAFARGTAETAFASALWARFAQPAAIVYANDKVARTTGEHALARAVTTLLSKTAPLMTGPYTVEDLWIKAFQATYRAELRPESDSKAEELVHAQRDRFIGVGEAALQALALDPSVDATPDQSAIWAWRGRRWWGRLLNLLRLIKAAFTFRGGLDYAAWKIERHSGVKIELTERDRAHPVLTGLRLLLRVKRQGGLN